MNPISRLAAALAVLSTNPSAAGRGSFTDETGVMPKFLGGDWMVE